jgi:hypothetical protein
MPVSLSVKSYSSKLRDQMQPGDIIAFWGKTQFSQVIKWFTGSPVSHVAILLKTQRPEATKEGYSNQIIKSTVKEDKSGVIVSRLSRAVEHYSGEIWWLPLHEKVRAKLNFDKYFDWLNKQEGKKYDMGQLIPCALDILGPLTHTQEDYEKLFCSELVVGALKAGGVVPKKLNASEVTPDDLMSWDIYANTYIQPKGKRTESKALNTRPVGNS